MKAATLGARRGQKGRSKYDGAEEEKKKGLKR